MDQSLVEMTPLRETPLFAELPPGDLEAVLRTGEQATFLPGEAIVRQGEVGDAMYVILRGVAEVEVGGRSHRLERGDFFGEMALASARKRMATVRAVETVEALMVSAEDFTSFVEDHPGVALAMLKGVVDRLREVEQRIDAWIGS